MIKLFPYSQLTYNESTKTLKYFKKGIKLKTYHARAETIYDYNPHMYFPSIWMPKWWKTPNEIPRRIKEFEAATDPMFQRKFGRNNLLPHQRCAIHWLYSHEDSLIVKCDNNLVLAIIERNVYIERVYIE